MLNGSATPSGGSPRELRHRPHVRRTHQGQDPAPIARRHRESAIADMAEAEPKKSLPDVPLHKRGFGVMDEDVP
jgi:hypothetical protein